jgi:NAD(P)-dependent dehydrogenase (short-subunit alcohol dehydrogenase family)
MLMTSVDEFNLEAEAFGVYPELAGKRVLITGVTSQQGVDLVRAFAEHRARLILQLDEANEATLALLEHAAPLAIDLSVTAERLTDNDSIVRFARKSVAEFGGVDIVINIVTLDPGSAANGTLADVERRVCDLMLLPCLVARVAANRMRLTHTEGLILNVAVLPPNANAATRAFAGVAKATLVAMTRSEANAWADQGLRFNAVAPEVGSVGPRADGTRLAGEADVAALALYLGSGNGRNLAGHVFEAEPAWNR